MPFGTWHHHQSLPGHLGRDSQLAVIITTSFNCSYLGSEKKRKKKTCTGEYRGPLRLYFYSLWRRDIGFSSFSVAPANHLIRAFKSSPCMRRPSFNRLEADGEGGPTRPSWTSADHDSAFWLQCVVILDGAAWKSAWTNSDSRFPQDTARLCALVPLPRTLSSSKTNGFLSVMGRKQLHTPSCLSGGRFFGTSGVSCTPLRQHSLLWYERSSQRRGRTPLR